MKYPALQHLGLSDREVTIYLSLLESGPVSIRDIAAASGINRGTTYETLKSLAQKGVVSYFPRGKRRVFMAEDPERLITLAESKQHALAEALEQLRSDVEIGRAHV